MHDGSTVRFRRTAEDYDPTDRDAADAYVRAHQATGEVPTGLLFIDPESRDHHDVLGTVDQRCGISISRIFVQEPRSSTPLMENYR